MSILICPSQAEVYTNDYHATRQWHRMRISVEFGRVFHHKDKTSAENGFGHLRELDICVHLLRLLLKKLDSIEIITTNHGFSSV